MEMEFVDEILLNRPNLLDEIESEGFGVFCQNMINMHEIIQAPCRWFNSVSDMFSGLLYEEDNSSATASDGHGDRVVNGRNDEESVSAICNKPEDEPAEVILDKTSSGSVEVDDNASTCDDEGKELCSLNNPAQENKEITETNSSHCSSPKKTDETCTSQESASIQVCSSNEGDEPAKVDNLEPYVWPQKDGDVLSSEEASLSEDYASPNKIDADSTFAVHRGYMNKRPNLHPLLAALEKIDMFNSADVVDLENEVEHKFKDVDLQDTNDEDYDHTLENIDKLNSADVSDLENEAEHKFEDVDLQDTEDEDYDHTLEKTDMLNSADVADLENEVECKFEDVDLQDTDDEDYDQTLASYSEHKHKPYKIKFGASLIPKLRWLKAKKHADNVQYDTDMDTHDIHGFARSTPLDMKQLDDSLESDWELL